MSTHIRGQGHAVFQLRDNHLELRRRSDEDVPVDRPWITATGLIAEGLTGQPYLHLDIRTPFGETVGETQVENALSESLGPRKDKYRLGGWHIQFVEDTNLGSNHRIFVDLIDAGPQTPVMGGMDAGLSLEVAMEALGELAMAEKGENTFQLLVGGKHSCYSLLYLNGSPFHVLRVEEGAGPKSALRLRRHREFLLAQGKVAGSSLKTFLSAGDPLLECESILELRPETVSFGVEKGMEKVPLLHLGLAHAARQKDLLAHNRVGETDRSRNGGIRSRHRFFQALGATLAFCLLVAMVFLAAIHHRQSQLQSLKVAASAYEQQVKAIRALRHEKASIEGDLEGLRPVWNRPLDWTSLYSGLAAAMPRESGIDGLTVARRPDGDLELSFRAWVRDWDQVQVIQRKLAATHPFASVSLSEQRKDLTTGVVIFHVTCRLERS